MSTSTELVPLETKYPVLAMTADDVREAFEANQTPGGRSNIESFLTRIKPPKQGATLWTVPDGNGNDVNVPEIRGIIVYRGFRGLVWPRKECTAGTLPILRSDDLRNAYQVGDDWGDVNQKAVEKLRRADGNFDWVGDDGKGGIAGEGGPCGWPLKSDKTAKRTRLAKELRVLCFMPEGQGAPWLIFVPSTSVNAIDDAIRKMSMGGTPYYGAEVRIFAKAEKSKSGYDISKFQVVKTGVIPKALRDVIKRNYTDTLAATIRNIEAEADDEGDDLA